ncbi:SIR2 family protein [Pseudomonas poae]|uniref:SIR2 family protein n=1 Tax=Pseudomonas poae TaxID=200451 RepID=UPI0030CB9909
MTSHITLSLTRLLAQNSGAPFLFIGSGFSRRYIGLEQWDELLKRFCSGIKEFGYYSSQHNKDMPKAASEMARDFNDVWWKSEEFAESRGKYSDTINSVSSALKHEMAEYLTGISHNKVAHDGILKELEVLSRLNVDGIITTNWDLFLEELFPDYKVFIGQEELLFSNPQSIAEVYKIHGCASQPNSLVLTNEDYELFESKNPYLAAKLITIFIEHPIIFIGYSISDKNIQNIIGSIVNCLGQDKLDVFGRNLVFIQRAKEGEEPSFQPSMMAIGETRLNITVIRTGNYLDVYEAIESTKRKIPARILRYCKEQMYDLVKSNDPETKLAVVDIDQIDNKEDVEFVMGVGVAREHEGISRQGYKGVSLDNIFADIISVDSKYDAAELLREVYPTLLKRSNKYIPGYKYLRLVGVNSVEELRASEFSEVEAILNKSERKDYRYVQYKKQYENQFKTMGTAEIIASVTAEKATVIIPFQDDAHIDLAAVKEFLWANRESLKTDVSSYATYFRKLACLIDRVEFGF